ncbi:MAG: hypothetical protein KKA79_07540 [Nanoarchaeota archaeon]|nr:hypothetical protein [Nanoarchaeota archaeon]
MESLSALLAKYFPEEKIINRKTAFLIKSKSIAKIGRVPSGFLWKWFGLKIPTEVIETDKAFYFDLRRRIPYDAVFVMIAFPLLSITLFYILPISFFHQTISILVPILFIGMSIVWALLVLITKDWLQNILVYKKEWISAHKIEGKKHTIAGNMPQVYPYLSNFLSIDDMKKRWLIYKIPGVALLTEIFMNQGLKATLFRLDFTIEYEEV